jgi:hypothetical protein
MFKIRVNDDLVSHLNRYASLVLTNTQKQQARQSILNCGIARRKHKLLLIVISSTHLFNISLILLCAEGADDPVRGKMKAQVLRDLNLDASDRLSMEKQQHAYIYIYIYG